MAHCTLTGEPWSEGGGGGGVLCLDFEARKFNLPGPLPFQEFKWVKSNFRTTDVFRKGRRKELHLFRSDINPLPFLVIYAVEHKRYEFPL